MKENENLLKSSTSIMTIPLSSVIFFFRINLHVVNEGVDNFFSFPFFSFFFFLLKKAFVIITYFDITLGVG